MKLTYEQFDYLNTDDPANVLVAALSTVEAPDVSKRKLGELLYTMSERMTDYSLDCEDALMIWSIVEIACTASDEDIEKMRM